MATFSGNLSFKISFELGSKVLLSPWVKKASFISCCRNYQSSGPVRYIPKQYSKVEETQISPPRNNLEETESGNCLDSISLRNSVSQRSSISGKGFQNQISYFNGISCSETVKSSNVFGDSMDSFEIEDESDHELDDFRISFKNEAFEEDSKRVNKPKQDSEIIANKATNRISDIETVKSSNVHGDFIEYFELEDESNCEPEEVFNDFRIDVGNEAFELGAKRNSKTKQDAEKISIEALATRAFTALELRKKLCGKKFPVNIIDEVLTDFKRRGLINDYLYAETFSQSRWSSLAWGPRRIKQALLQKGVTPADADKAMKHVFEGDDSGGDKEPILGMSKLSMEHLFVQASKKWLQGQDVPLEKRKSRIVRWLQYRGFNWGVTGFILKKLESQYPS